MSEDDDLREKLKALGMHIGAKNLKPKIPEARFRIEDVIPTREEITPMGTTLVYEEVYPIDYLHGNIRLASIHNYEFIAKWANIEASVGSAAGSLLFLDTETSGISRAAGTFVFLVGLGFLKPDGFHILQIILSDPHLEAALLAALARFTEGFDTVVTYNGKSFDIPLLENRHILHRIPSPFETLSHIDLLHLARKLWRNRLASRRLGDLEHSILQLRRGKEEVPGWLVPEIYKEYLHTGDARPLAGVFYHNAVDVLSLAGIFIYIAQVLDQPLIDDLDDRDLAAIGNIFEDMGSFETAKSIYQLCINKDLPRELYFRTLRRYANIHKRERQWEKAISIWRAAAEFDIEACIELAKYYEHYERQFGEAIEWTQKALGMMEARTTNYLEYDMNDLRTRYKRLISKSDHNRSRKDSQ